MADHAVILQFPRINLHRKHRAVFHHEEKLSYCNKSLDVEVLLYDVPLLLTNVSLDLGI